MEENQPKPRSVGNILGLAFLLLNAIGAIAVIANAFVPFLPETAFAIIAIIFFVEFFIAYIAGKIIGALYDLRKLRHLAETLPEKPQKEP